MVTKWPLLSTNIIYTGIDAQNLFNLFIYIDRNALNVTKGINKQTRLKVEFRNEQAWDKAEGKFEPHYKEENVCVRKNM